MCEMCNGALFKMKTCDFPARSFYFILKDRPFFFLLYLENYRMKLNTAGLCLLYNLRAQCCSPPPFDSADLLPKTFLLQAPLLL